MLTLLVLYRLRVTAHDAAALILVLLALCPDQFEVMREKPVARDGTPVGRARERADDARANEDGEVEAVLGVPFWGWESDSSAFITT